MNIGIIIIIFFIVIFFLYKTKEPFGELLPSVPKEELINVHETRMTGSEFVGYPHYLPWEDIYRNPSAGYMLDDNNNGVFSYPICSKNCCSPQYPPPFEIPTDHWLEQNKDNYVPSAYTCNNSWEDTGCLCLPDKSRTYLESRGENKHRL